MCILGSRSAGVESVDPSRGPRGVRGLPRFEGSGVGGV